MVVFLICAVVFVVIAIAVIFFPLWFGTDGSKAEADRREEVLRILRQEAQHLEREHQAGRIDDDEYEESRQELERRVLEEARGDDDEVRSGKVTRLSRFLAIVLSVVLPISAAGVYMGLGAPDTIGVPSHSFAQTQAGGDANAHANADMNQMLEGLKARLVQDPNDAQGWYLLARTSAQLGRFKDAVEAYKRLNEMVPDNADLIAEMADMIAAQHGKVITPEVVKLLDKAIALNPYQMTALALLAIHSWDLQRYSEAIKYWETMCTQLPTDSDEYRTIQGNIAEARRLLSNHANIVSGTTNAPTEGTAKPLTKDAAAQPQAQANATKAQEVAAMQGAKEPRQAATAEAFVAGEVTLSKSLKGKVEPNDVVFIYARPVSGSRMPVAFMKITASQLPYQFKITDSMRLAMGAGSLADSKQVIVGARVSRNGNFMPQTGDLEGETKNPVQVGQKGIAVEITQVLP